MGHCRNGALQELGTTGTGYWELQGLGTGLCRNWALQDLGNGLCRYWALGIVEAEHWGLQEPGPVCCRTCAHEMLFPAVSPVQTYPTDCSPAPPAPPLLVIIAQVLPVPVCSPRSRGLCCLGAPSRAAVAGPACSRQGCLYDQCPGKAEHVRQGSGWPLLRVLL